MSGRKLSDINELRIVGGALCLDFVNTTGARHATPRERLRRYDDLLVWSTRTGIADATTAASLAAEGVERAADAERALERARAFREELYRLFRAVAEEREPPPETVASLADWWRRERSRRALVADGGRFALRLDIGADELDGLLWPIAASAVDLLTSDRLARLKRCGECDWLFLDDSKNGSRSWCKAACGNRVRARRHYERVRRSTEAKPPHGPVS